MHRSATGVLMGRRMMWFDLVVSFFLALPVCLILITCVLLVLICVDFFYPYPWRRRVIEPTEKAKTGTTKGAKNNDE